MQCNLQAQTSRNEDYDATDRHSNQLPADYKILAAASLSPPNQTTTKRVSERRQAKCKPHFMTHPVRKLIRRSVVAINISPPIIVLLPLRTSERRLLFWLNIGGLFYRTTKNRIFRLQTTPPFDRYSQCMAAVIPQIFIRNTCGAGSSAPLWLWFD